jgi:hypothetical protein
MPIVTPIVALIATTSVDRISASRAPWSSCDSVSTPLLSVPSQCDHDIGAYM